MELDVERYWRFLDAQESYEEAKAIIYGAPMENTVSFRTGTRHGPRGIREFSWALDEYSHRLDKELEEIRFYDAGDLGLPWGNVQKSMRIIRETTSKFLNENRIPFVLGGEHLITLPLVEAVVEKHPGLAVLQLDAHADLRDEFLGEHYSHATVMRRIAEHIGGENLYQLGIRSGNRDEFDFAAKNTNLYPDEIVDPLKDILDDLVGRPIYISIDIDVVDPAFAPGTGSPDPCGCTSLELLEAVYLMENLQVVGMDLNEVSPELDSSGRTALLAAKVIRELLLMHSK